MLSVQLKILLNYEGLKKTKERLVTYIRIKKTYVLSFSFGLKVKEKDNIKIINCLMLSVQLKILLNYEGLKKTKERLVTYIRIKKLTFCRFLLC